MKHIISILKCFVQTKTINLFFYWQFNFKQIIVLIDFIIYSSLWHRICRPHAGLSTSIYVQENPGWPLRREMGRQSLPFPHAGREIPQKNFPSPMREGKLKFFFSRSGKWEKNLFPFHKKSLILLILVDKNSFFSDFFSCEKRNSKKISFLPTCEKENSPKKLLFSHEGREIEKKSSREMRNAESRIPFLPFAVTLGKSFREKKLIFSIFYRMLFEAL